MNIFQVAELARVVRRQRKSGPPPSDAPASGRLTALSLAPTAMNIPAVSAPRRQAECSSE
jgi:hypothetical protein